MNVISTQSFTKVIPLIQEGNSYVNIHGRLRQKLSSEESELFAHIQMESNGAKWLVADDLPLKPYPEADAYEKEEIAIFIEEMKASITRKIASEMKFVPMLFRVPTEKEIFWYRDQNNKMRVVLAQWGFVLQNKLKEVNIIDQILIQPRPLTQTEVTIHIDYSDGNPAQNDTFMLSLFNNTKPFTTNENGDFLVGNMFAGKSFSIENEFGDKREFTVEKDVNRYVAVFDFKTNYSVKVVNQNGGVKPGYEITIDGMPYRTDDTGMVTVENVILTPNLSITVQGKDAPKCSYTLNRKAEDNVFVYKIGDPETAYVIKVLNQHEGLKPNFPVLVNGQEKTSDASGSINSEDFLFVPGSKVTVTLPDHTNAQEFVIDVDREKNSFIYRVEEKEQPKTEPITRIRVVGYDGSPLPDLTVNVNTKKGKTLTSVTDKDGYVYFLSSNFVDGEKPKVHFVVSKEYQKTHHLNKKRHGK